jgi:hypothetical protein
MSAAIPNGVASRRLTGWGRLAFANWDLCGLRRNSPGDPQDRVLNRVGVPSGPGSHRAATVVSQKPLSTPDNPSAVVGHASHDTPCGPLLQGLVRQSLCDRSDGNESDSHALDLKYSTEWSAAERQIAEALTLLSNTACKLRRKRSDPQALAYGNSTVKFDGQRS